MANAINLSRKTAVFAKVEKTYNTIETIATSGATSNALVLYDEVNPLQIDTKIVDKQVIRASYTKNPNLVGRQLYTIKPKTVLMGSPGVFYNPATGTFDGHTGEAVTGSANGVVKASFFDALLRGAGMKSTINASTSLSIVYTPRSSGHESLSIDVYVDGWKHRAYGCIGNVMFEGRGGEALDVTFDYKGNIYQTSNPSYAGNPTVTYPVDIKQLAGSYALSMTTTSTVTPIVRSFKFDSGNQVVERADLNSSLGLYGLYIVDRKPTLELVMEVDSASTFNPWTDLAAGTAADLVFTHGSNSSTSGKTWKFVFPTSSLQMRNVQYGDDQGIRTYNISYDIVSTTDDGEWTIIHS